MLARGMCWDSIDWMSQRHFNSRGPLKEQVMHDLKIPVYDLVHALEIGPVKQALAAERLLDIDPTTRTGANAEILGPTATARRLMGIALAPYVEVLDILENALHRLGIVRVDGSTLPRERSLHIHSSRQDEYRP